jgi:hypothetical protein
VKFLFMTVVLLPALSMAAPKLEKEKCAELQSLSEKNTQTVKSYEDFLVDYSKMNLNEKNEVLTGTIQRVYLRLRAIEKLTGIKADAAVMQKSGDILNDVVVGDVYTEEQAAEKMKAQIGPLNEQMSSVLRQYQNSEAFKKCNP